MGNLSIANMASTVVDFQREYLYQTLFEELPTSLRAEWDNFKLDVDYYNTDAIFPGSKTNMVKQLWAGEYIWVPTVKGDSGQAVYVFNLDKEWKAYRFLMALKELTGTVTNASGTARGSALAKAKVVAWDRDKATIKESCTLYNVQVSEVEQLTLNKAGSSWLKVRALFHWERVGYSSQS